MNTLLKICTFLALIALGAGLQCYKCNSETGPCLKEDLTDDILETCDELVEGKKAFCRITNVWLSMRNKEEFRVYRGCAYERREDKDCYQKRDAGKSYIQESCQCYTDKCNSATSIVTTSAAATALLTTLIVRLL